MSSSRTRARARASDARETGASPRCDACAGGRVATWFCAQDEVRTMDAMRRGATVSGTVDASVRAGATRAGDGCGRAGVDRGARSRGRADNGTDARDASRARRRICAMNATRACTQRMGSRVSTNDAPSGGTSRSGTRIRGGRAESTEEGSTRKRER